MNLKWRSNKQKQKKQRGSVMALAALSLTAFLGAAGLSVDINHLYSASSELQNATDMAALSAASALNNTTKGVIEATNRAVAAMNKVDFDNADVVITRDNVRFAVNLSTFTSGGAGLTEDQAKANPSNVRFAKVTLSPQSVNVYFAKYFLAANSVTMTKTAVAGMSVGITPENGEMLAVAQDDVNNNGLDVYSGGQTCADNWQYTAGCTYNLSLMPPCDVLESKYFLLSENNKRQSSDNWQRRVALKLDQAYCPNSFIKTRNHPNGNDIANGINILFDVENSPSITAAEFPPDLNVAENITYQQYKDGSPLTAPSHTGLPDRRVVIMPIVNKSTWQQVDAHTGKARVLNYGVFFITKKIANYSDSAATIRAEMIGDPIVIGAGGTTSCATTNQNITVPVLYK